jgi:hypothetical protein
VVLLGAVTWPLLFTDSGFAGDWEHHLWLVWHQELSIRATHLPSLFLNSSYSLLNPIFAFYGGTLYAITGALSLGLGPVHAYVLIYLLDFVAAFSGWYWLGRSAGVGRWSAMVPGLIFVTSSYYLVIAYVQGDWPEFTGISMIPLMLAAGLAVLRADKLRTPAAFALAASCILFFGSHNITILLGLSSLAITAVALILCSAEARRLVSGRGLVRVLGIVVPAALVSAWYLLPATVYASRTRLGREYAHSRESLHETAWLVSFKHLFTFSRTAGPGIPAPYDLSLSLPLLAIAWVAVGIFILPRGARNRGWVGPLLVCAGVALAIAMVMTHVGLLLALPRLYATIQFSYRLEIYVILALCGAVLVALALSSEGSQLARVWKWLAVPVCAASLLGAVQQLRSYPYPGKERDATLKSYGEVDTGNNEDYQDASGRLLNAGGVPRLNFALEKVQGDSVSASVDASPGTQVTTNIAAGSYLVHVTGAKPIGVDVESDDMVLQIEGHGAKGIAGAGTSTAGLSVETVTVGVSKSLPIVLGRILSICGLAILALELVLLPAYRHLRSTIVAVRARERRLGSA